MGKAAKRRKAYQKGKLVAISHEDPELFEAQWDMRLESWLIDVHKLAVKWEKGEAGNRRIFEILENAMKILSGCEQQVAARVMQRTYDELSNECCVQVARIIDPRIYRLSNFKERRRE